MSYDTIKLEKGMYAVSGKSFSQVLEELDPTAQYEGSAAAGLDAFERQLKRFDIKVSGQGSDYVGKFFSTTQSSTLFPEYVSRAVHQGIEEMNLLDSVVATKTKINGLDYRTLSTIPSDGDKELKEVGEGAYIPQTVVRTQDNLVKLNKRGRMLVASYEALKFQRLDLFTVTLKQIGAYIARQQFADAVSVLINGDGNENPARVIKAASSAVSYTDLIKLLNSLDPYSMTTLIASPETMTILLSMDEFKNPQTGINFQGTGKVGHPLGAQFIKSSAVSDGKLVALDKNCALEMVIASDVAVDYDKLIDRQLERAAVTATVGFAKIFPDAVSVLSVG